MYGSPTRVTIEVADQTPAVPNSVERSVDVLLDGAGPLAVLGWGDDDPVALVDVPAGPLNLRVIWAGSDAASQHPDAEVGGNTVSPESVYIQVWPSDSL